MRLSELDTPAVLIENRRVRRNIHDMQAAAHARELSLRPHAKTHKSPIIAGWQLAAGATGITLAKVGEAEVFVEEGITDVRLAYPVPPTSAGRVMRLMDRAHLSIVVDDLEVARLWSATMSEAGRTLEVLVKVDVGFRRCGIDTVADPEAAASFVLEVERLPGLELRGLLSHAGQSYTAATQDEILTIARSEAEQLRALATRVRSHGVDVAELSVGATPTVRHSLDEKGLTELRPGNYLLYDLTQVALGSATIDDCALSVLTTVVSRPTKDRVVLDAGSKTLSSDIARGPGASAGYGALFDIELGRSIDGLQIGRLSEEHGVVPLADTSCRLRPGDRVRVIPNHACVVVNLADQLRLVDGDAVVETIPIAARGRNT